MLSELVYLSFRSATCTDDDVKKILEEARRSNGKEGITGVLVYSKDKFCKYWKANKQRFCYCMKKSS